MFAFPSEFEPEAPHQEVDALHWAAGSLFHNANKQTDRRVSKVCRWAGLGGTKSVARYTPVIRRCHLD